MATSIEEATDEAIAELELKEWVVKATLNSEFDEEKPGNYFFRRLDVLHQTAQGGFTYSGQGLYINKDDFTYIWMRGAQLEPVPTPFKDLITLYLDIIKSVLGFEYVQIVSVDEIYEVAELNAIKSTTGDEADRYTIRIFRIDTPPHYGYKVVKKRTVLDE